MDIFIAIDKKDEEKFKSKAIELKNQLKINKSNVKDLEVKENMQIKKISICIAFSDNKEYIEKINKNKKLEVICITSKLDGQYILSILEFVKDIYILNNSTEEMTIRILSFIKKYELRKRCLRGSI